MTHNAENDAGAGTCPECAHQWSPQGCTGDPTPSDLWAGVSPSACDCPCPIPCATCETSGPKWCVEHAHLLITGEPNLRDSIGSAHKRLRGDFR